MASGRVVTAADSFTLQEQIEQLQGRISLSGRDDKAFKAVAKKENQQNDQRISQLKTDISQARGQLARLKPEDERILKTAFRKHPKEYRVVKTKTSEETRVYLDDKVLELRRQVEALQARRFEQEERVARLAEHLEKLRERAHGMEMEETRQRIRHIENNLNKTQVKGDTADLIHRHYDAIVYHLKQDEASCPDLLERLEQAAFKQTQELRNIKMLCLQAQGLRDNLKASLASMEYEMYKVKHERDSIINSLRKEVERRSEPGEQKKAKQDEPYAEVKVTKDQSGTPDAVAVQQMLQKENERLLEAAKVSDLKLFLTSWKRLSRASRHLDDQRHLKESQKSRLLTERRRLEHALQHLRYSSSGVEAELALQKQIEATLEKEKAAVNSTTNAMYDSGSVLQDVKLGMESLLEKLKAIELQPRFHAQYPPTGEELLDSLLRCDAVITQLMVETIGEEAEAEELSGVLARMSVIVIRPEETIVAAKVRVPLEGKKQRAIPPAYTHEDTDVAYGLTRENLKAMSQALLDANTKKKKRKSKKRKK